MVKMTQRKHIYVFHFNLILNQMFELEWLFYIPPCLYLDQTFKL
jgi:hypothetical protein